MKRAILAAVICAGIFLLLHRSAPAAVESCPAVLSYERVGPARDDAQPSSLFGFDLSALGPRTITSAKFAFHTSAGWFTLDLPATTLAEKDRHYNSAWVSFTRRDYISPILYVRFPQAATIEHAWVYAAAAENDGPFGWQAKGSVTCPPLPGQSPEQMRMLDLGADEQSVRTGSKRRCAFVRRSVRRFDDPGREKFKTRSKAATVPSRFGKAQ